MSQGRRVFPLVALIVVSAILAKSTNAALLGSNTVTHAFMSVPGEDILVTPFYGDGLPSGPGPGPGPGDPVATTFSPFGSIEVNASAVGVPYISDSSIREFGGAATFLTNGTDDLIGDTRVVGTFFVTSGSPESLQLSGPGFTDPDFQGYVIDSMVLTITSFTQIPVGGGFSNNLLYEVEYHGALVPLPTTILLLGSGLIGLAGFKRSRKK